MSCSRSILIIAACTSALALATNKIASATNVMYADPAGGWYHALQGDSAFYYDPDGPNPDYTRSSGPDDGNKPGGRSNSPALINPGPCANDNACAAAAIWQNTANQWEGSAPGAPLGGPPGPTPVPPPAPGGVGTFTTAGTSYLRIQDPGQPQAWGWADKGAQGFDGGPRQEGNNRKIEFKHQMDRDAAFVSQRDDILDFGVTVSFRTRIATSATGPIDALYPEGGGTTPTPWPTEGLGYPVAANRGIFMIRQTGVDGPGQLSFGLLNNNTIATLSNSALLKTGLVMNNQSNGSPGSPVDTSNATAATLNVAPIANSQMNDWHEFWITVQRLASPLNGNTHQVNVYLDGSLTPQTFNVVLVTQNEFGTGSHLGLGLTSGSAAGAVDVDFFAYKEGVVPPTLPGLPGDFNNDGKVDAADYVRWRKNNLTSNALPNDGGLGVPIGSSHYNLWRANFGHASGSGTGIDAAAVPEPSTVLLLFLSTVLFSARRRTRV